MSTSAPVRTVPTRGAVLRFRVMAWLTGTMLLVLVLVAIPLQIAGHHGPVAVVGFIHGWLFPIYLVTVFQLAYQLRWHLVRALLVGLAGTVPFASFVAERRVTRWLASP